MRTHLSFSFSATMGEERDRDMLTLQTCVPPTFEERLVVRADHA